MGCIQHFQFLLNDSSWTSIIAPTSFNYFWFKNPSTDTLISIDQTIINVVSAGFSESITIPWVNGGFRFNSGDLIFYAKNNPGTGSSTAILSVIRN